MVAVISNNGSKLMPTTEYRARKLLSSGKAEIHQYRPFTIKLVYRESGSTQPVEYKCDSGYQHIGISICTEMRELVNEQRDMLDDEVDRHDNRRIYRRTRRNRKTRYRKPRFDNRRGLIGRGGFAPSIRNRRDVHIHLFQMYYKVMPFREHVEPYRCHECCTFKRLQLWLPSVKDVSWLVVLCCMAFRTESGKI